VYECKIGLFCDHELPIVRLLLLPWCIVTVCLDLFNQPGILADAARVVRVRCDAVTLLRGLYIRKISLLFGEALGFLSFME